MSPKGKLLCAESCDIQRTKSGGTTTIVACLQHTLCASIIHIVELNKLVVLLEMADCPEVTIYTELVVG